MRERGYIASWTRWRQKTKPQWRCKNMSAHLMRSNTYCQNHAPSTLLAMSTARHQMSPHILPSPLRFGLLPPSRPQCYVSSLPHQQGLVVRYFGSLSLLTYLAQHSWSLFDYSELLDLHHVGFHFVFSRIWTRMARGHPRSRAACIYFCQSSVLCIIINSHKSLSTSQLTRDWTVITCVNGSTRNPRCSHLYMEPKLLLEVYLWH